MMHHIDIHIRSTENGNILIDFRNSQKVITDIHEHINPRSAVNTIIHAIMGMDYNVRKVR